MINTIDISGKWELFISENNRTSLPDNYNDSIILPDTLSDAAKVAENKNRMKDTLPINTHSRDMRGSDVRVPLKAI